MATEVTYWVETVAGTNDVGDGELAREAQLAGVEGIAVDSSGNLYIADTLDHRVRRVDAFTGRIHTVAGAGHAGFSGDGGPAKDALLNRPYGLALDAAGNLYIADYGNGRVRRVDPEGVIETVAGGGAAGPDVSPAISARLSGPRNVAADRQGVLYISDFADNLVYRVSPDGAIAVIAGSGEPGYGGDGPAAAASLNAPAGLAITPDGALLIADSGNNRVRRVFAGQIKTILGPETGEVELSQPTGVAVASDGSLYVADSGHNRIVHRDRHGTLEGYPAGGPEPVRDVAAGKRVYVGGGRRVAALDPSGSLETVAGSGAFGLWEDGVPAATAYLDGPIGVGAGFTGDVFLAEEGRHRVRRIDAAGFIETVAGTGVEGYAGDNGPAEEAELVDPVAVIAGPDGQIWISDHLGHVIRHVNAAGIITTLAGTGFPGAAGDFGPATEAALNRPRGLALDEAGNLYIADSGNHRIRVVTPEGMIASVAGSGVRGYSGDESLAFRAQMDTPLAVAVAPDGTVYVADSGNHVIRKITPTGLMRHVAGDGIPGFSGDGGPASLARLHYPSGLAIDADGGILIADTNNHRIRRIGPDGIIETIAGSGAPGFSGDGGPATAARFRYPSGIAVAPDGLIYVADADNRRIRRLTPIYAPPPILVSEPCTVLHAASYQSGPVAPGEIVTIFGDGVGPVTSLAGRLTAGGSLDVILGDVSVLFNGSPAPLFFASPNQINAQVPYDLAGADSAAVEVFQAGKPRRYADVPVASAVPGLFTLENGTGPAAALNQNGSLNSMSNPAARGSVVTLYATGEGATDPILEAGYPMSAPLPAPVLPVEVRIAGFPAEVLYAGGAPGFVGLMQVNVRIPDGLFPTGELSVELFVGGVSSQKGVTISVR